MVEQDASSQQIKALVDLGAAVYRRPSDKRSVLQKIRRKQDAESRSTALRTATLKRRDDLISILASTSDQTSIDEAFETAVANEDVASMDALLSAGADPNRQGNRLLEFVRNQRTVLVVSMGSGLKSISSAIATKALPSAIRNCDVLSARILLHHGADPNCDSGTVFSEAVSSMYLGLTAYMCLSDHDISTDSVSAAAAAISIGSSELSPHFELSELLIAAGLPLVQMNQALIQAAENGCKRLAALLIQNKALIIYDQCRAAKIAVEKSNLELLDVLLEAHDSVEASNILLPHTQSLRTTMKTSARLSVINSLVHLGPRKDTLNKCLLNATQRSQLDEVEILVVCGATADYNSGEALELAVQNANIQVLSALCPTIKSSRTCLRAISSLVKADRGSRLTMARAVLAIISTLKGFEINQALLHVIKEPEMPPDYDLIRLLIGHADVNTSQGECLRLATKWADQRLIDLFLQHGSPSPATIVMKSLSTRTAAGEGLQAALVHMIDSKDDCLRYIELLVTHCRADVDYNGASAVLKSLEKNNLKALDMLLEHSVSTVTYDLALNQAISMKDHVARLSACKSILEKETSQMALDKALEVRSNDSDVDTVLIQLLLSCGASINYRSASSIQAAIATSDLRLFTMLIKSQMTTSDTLDVAISHILILRNENDRFKFMTSLLENTQSDAKATLTRFLPQSFGSGKNTFRIARLFLQNGADVDIRPNLAVSRAIEILDLEVLNLLLEYAREPTTYTQALNDGHALTGTDQTAVYSVIFERLGEIPRISDDRNVAINISKALITHTGKSSPDLANIKLLLKHGADVHFEGNKSLWNAVRQHNNVVLKELLCHMQFCGVASELFSQASADSHNWNTPSGPIALQLLIEHGVKNEILASALLKATTNYYNLSQSRHILQLLLSAGVVPDLDVIKAASRTGRAILFQELLQAEVPKRVLEEAVLYSLSQSPEEAEMLQILKHIDKKSKDDLDVNRQVCGLLPCLFQSFLNGYSGTVFDTLLKMGASHEQKAVMQIDDRTGEETTSILIYILSKGRFDQHSDLGTTLVQLLLPGQTNIDFETPKSQLNAIILAAIRANSETLKGVVKAHANINSRWRMMSPLAIVSSRGDSSMVECLIHAGAMVNDGSLHEAAMHCDAKIVDMIVEAGHDPNFPSPLHEYRSPLHTIVMSSVQEEADSQRMKDTIIALVTKGAQFCTQQDGKSLLFLALESPRATHTTASLLSACMGDLINENFNLYHHQGLVRSALGYVKSHPRFQNDEATKLKLIRILESYGAKNIYYNETGPQDTTLFAGAPESVKRREDDRLEREQQRANAKQDHEDWLARERARAQEQQQLSKQAHTQALTQQRLEAAQQQTLNQQGHRLALAQDAERTTAKDTAFRASATLAIEMDKSRAAEQDKIAAHQRRAEREHAQALSRVRIEEQRETNKQRQALMSDENGYAERNHRREMLQIEAKGKVVQQQSQLASRQSRMLETQKELAQLAASPSVQELEWQDVD
ncbi:hypothetical protein MBLNU459_g3864t1 [Dothideomycetes sp. NU459]